MTRIHGSAGRRSRQEKPEELTERLQFEALLPRRSTNVTWYTGGMLYRQGGLTGYASHEIIATPWTDEKIRVCQAFAWNPFISEAKIEGTFVLIESGPEMLMRSSGGGE